MKNPGHALGSSEAWRDDKSVRHLPAAETATAPGARRLVPILVVDVVVDVDPTEPRVVADAATQVIAHETKPVHRHRRPDQPYQTTVNNNSALCSSSNVGANVVAHPIRPIFSPGPSRLLYYTLTPPSGEL